MINPSGAKKPLRERLNISKVALRYPWLTIGFWIAVMVAGIFAYSSLKYALFPDITFPVVVVNTSAPIETVQLTETELTIPVENKLKIFPGLEGFSSTTYPGQSVVRLQFEVGTDLEKSSEKVEDVLQAIKFPDNTNYRIIPVNLNEAAVVSYAIESSNQNLEQLANTAKTKIIPEIAAISGVEKVNLLGEPVEFDLKKLAAGEEVGEGATLVRFKGNEALSFQVIKAATANSLEVVDAVQEKVEGLLKANPDYTLTLAATQADYIRDATGETINALWEALILSVVVITPFLGNWRATAISALAIPLSLLGTFVVMATLGFNLETITLLALALTVGNVVDDAIVDVENISRHLERGESPRQAAISATNEIGLTVTAATLTAVAVFLPVGTMGGVLGQFFKPFGITISAAMLISLLVARTLSPLLAAYWLRPKVRRNEQQESCLENAAPSRLGWQEKLNLGYQQLLRWSLGNRGIVVAIAILSFAGGLALIPLIPKGFIPQLDRGEFNITYIAPLPEIPPELQALMRGDSPENPSEIPAEIDPSQLDLSQLPEGIDPSQFPTGLNLNQIQTPPQLPEFNPLEDSRNVAQQLDEFAQKSPLVEKTYTVIGSRQGEPNKGTIYVKLKGDRNIHTSKVQDQFREELPQIEGVTTSVEDIQFVDIGGEKPVQVRIAGENLETLNQTARDIEERLKTIPGLVDISITGEANTRDRIVEIERNRGQRVATISANLGQGLTIGEASDRAVIEAKQILPADVTLQLGGDSARVNEILRSFAQTLTLSVLCILVILFLLFRSLIDTLVIFLSLPLSIVGAMIGLLIMQSDFGMISLIGIIFLLGLTNKNAILIVDYINQLRKEGMSRKEAILEAAPTRLRPIMMTTFATILGMIPIAIGFGAGAELRAPMAVAIIGGLITSTLLSLIVVPVIYDLLDRWRKKH